MWVFLNSSFLSIVADGKDDLGEMLLVRARQPGDIERVFPAAIVSRGGGSDYAYRASVRTGDVVKALSQAVRDIDYTNFKASVKDNARHDAYMDCWTALKRWQDGEPRYRPEPVETPALLAWTRGEPAWMPNEKPADQRSAKSRKQRKPKKGR